MGISTALLMTELREHLGDLSEDELSDDDALLLLNRSYWELLDKFPFRDKETTATFTTTAGTRSYAIPSSFDGLRQLSILDSDSGQLHVLDRATIHSHEEERNTGDDARGFPERYLREGNKIRLLPIPDDTYTITIKYWTNLTDLDNNPAVNATIPQSWHEIILFGACWRGFIKLRDFVACEQYKVQQIALINSSVPIEAKEEFDSHTAHLEVLGREYP